jgi:selenium metabolism protein YedF
VEALVETEINVNNLQRLARSLKLKFSSASRQDDCYLVTLQRDKDQPDAKAQPAPEKSAKESHSSAASSGVGTVVFLAKDKFGEGDPEFSANLLNLFLQTLLQSGHQPRAILMANSGVKLLDPSSSTAKVLQDFSASGVEVLACGLCVEFYGLKEKIPPAQITNMFAICEFLMAAEKVIQP